MFPEKQMPYTIYNTAVYVNSRHKITHTHSRNAFHTAYNDNSIDNYCHSQKCTSTNSIDLHTIYYTCSMHTSYTLQHMSDELNTHA